MKFFHKRLPLIVLLIFLILILVVILLVRNQETEETRQSPPPVEFFSGAPRPTVFVFTPKDIRAVPTLSPSEGLDLQLTQIRESINEISKSSSSLPYQTTLTTSSGLSVKITIPTLDSQVSSWTLAVNTTNIDFEIPNDDSNYLQARDSFREVASNVFSWIQSQGADPKKIYYIWGDRSSIQDRAEEWLK